MRVKPGDATPIDRGADRNTLTRQRELRMNDGANLLKEMNDRSREVFRRVVEGYLTNGEPVGSRSLTRSMTEKVSAATIRNVMQDLE